MGNKRKHSDEELRRKIEKLEKKLSKRARLQIQESSDDDINNDEIMEECTEDVEIFPLLDEFSQRTSPRPESPRQASPDRPASPERPASAERASPSSASALKSMAGPSSLKDPQDPSSLKDPQDPVIPSEPVCTVEPELEDDILELLGDAPKTESPLGPPIHKDVANRWQEILAKGLQKEAKDQIMKLYSVPQNCDLLLAPTLNPEVKAAIREVMIRRDSSLMYQQKQLGVAISALGTAVNSILSNETSKQKVLKPISDACRILCDLHFHETKTRRHFVITSINTELKDSLVNTVRDGQLFGDNVTEKIKTAKSIQKSGEALKNVPKPVFAKNNFANKPSTSKANLNFKTQQRKADNKTNTAAARGRPSFRAQRPGPSESYRPSPRSPPPPPAPQSSRRTRRI
ncbi:hypothetical protein ABMA28_012421 [Loxostege sticticalis]|uniref:Uncharacterized protein n=1 Tax=Loxostege sticticalis TaxID=481309 RepID=A0ABD0TN50_LOXSC